MIDQAELFQVLNSKLCHDLAGPIFAVESSIWFVDSTDEAARKEAQGLISNGMQKLVSCLKFYRYAYEISCSDNPVTIEEIYYLIKAVVAVSNRNVALTLKRAPNTVAPIIGKIIACVFITAFNACVAGELDINISKTEITFTINGKLFQQRSKNFDILKGEFALNPLDVQNVHEYYTYYLSQKIDCSFLINKTEELSTIKIIL